MLEAGKASEACPKLEESQRLDPGVGTLLYLADCYQQVGKTASAWATFRDAAYAARDARQADREKLASDYADALKPKLSYVSLKVATPDLPGIEVRRDGEVVRKSLWATAVPLDPGEHQLDVTATGKEPWTKKFTVPKGPSTVAVDVPPLADSAPVAAAPMPTPVADNSVQSPPKAPPSSQDSGSSASPLKTVGWISLGTGLAALAGSGVFSLLALKDNKEANSHCLENDLAVCDATGVDLGKKAASKAKVATVLFAAGGVLSATGLVLVIAAPAGKEKSAQFSVRTHVGLDSIAATVNGAF